MPVLRADRDANHHSRLQTDGILALCLVPAASCCAQQDLVASTAGAVMDVPIVATARLEGDVADGNAPRSERSQVALTGEVLREGVVLLPQRKI